MAKTNRQYWIERAQHREIISYTNGLDVTAFLANEYKKCAARVRKDINDFYSRYANDYGLTYEQAVREMSRPEFQEWRGTVEDYIKEIRREENPVLRERLMREYDARSYNSRISRLDGLCGNIQMNVDRLYSRAMNQLTGFLGEEFKGSYYRTIYDLQTVNGFSSNFSTISAELVEKTLAYPWSGANFSDRLWKNKNVLIDTIRETLTQGMIRGDNIRDMSKAVAEKLGSSLKNAERVVRTETSHIHNTAEIEAYKAGGYEQYEFMASFGERTCEVCGGLDGQHFKLKDIQYGVNFPPVHPNCRCTTVCWDEADEEQKALEGQKTLDYEEWYQKYVEGREQPKLESKDGAAVELPKQPVPTMPTENNEKIVGKSIDKTAESGAYLLKGDYRIAFNKISGTKEISETLAKEFSDQYDKATNLFGLEKLDKMKAVEVIPYRNDGIFGHYTPNSGVVTVFGAGGKDGKTFMAKVAKNMKKKGKWSTDSPLHAYLHELGHAIQEQLSATDTEYAEKLKKITELRQSILEDLTKLPESDIIKEKARILSVYGIDEIDEIDEFISEGIAEYLNGKPRQTAKKIVDILLGRS